MPGPAPILGSEVKRYDKVNVPGFGETWHNSTLEERKNPARGPFSEVVNAGRSSLPASRAAHMPGTQAGDRRVPAPRGGVRESPVLAEECRRRSAKVQLTKQWLFRDGSPA